MNITRQYAKFTIQNILVGLGTLREPQQNVINISGREIKSFSKA